MSRSCLRAPFLLLGASMVVARRAPRPALDAPKKGHFFTHGGTGEVVRVLAVSRAGCTIERAGVGRVTVPTETFLRAYTRAAAPPSAPGGAFRQRETAELKLQLEQFHGGWILRAEAASDAPDAPPRREERRFRSASDATFWFERLRRLDELPR